MTVNLGAELVEKYLAAYKAMDLETMNSCTDEEFTFSDPAFPHLDAKHARGMFAMFVKGRDTNKMEIEYGNIRKGVDDLTYTATYTVRYLFIGRPVTNTINSTLKISPKSNMIISQVDSFPFYPWARQALGLPGWVLGWTGFMQGKIQQTAGSKLERFITKESSKS